MTVDLAATKFHDEAKGREWLKVPAGRTAHTARTATQWMFCGWRAGRIVRDGSTVATAVASSRY
jgi:hypothetical protein